VGVRGEHKLDADLLGGLAMPFVEIEPVRLAVDLDRAAALACSRLMRLCLGLRGEQRRSREGQDQCERSARLAVEHGIPLVNGIPIRFVLVRLPDLDQIG
jgi:hypothetical protein